MPLPDTEVGAPGRTGPQLRLPGHETYKQLEYIAQISCQKSPNELFQFPKC